MASTKNGSLKPSYGLGLIALALIAVFGYDGVRTGINASDAKDDATQFAHDAADNYHSSPDVNATYAKIVAEAAAKSETVPAGSFTIDNSTGAVTLTVDRANSTLVLGRLHKPWTVLTGQATSAYTP